MRITKLLLSILVIASVMLNACKKDDDKDKNGTGTCTISDFAGSGTASGIAPNNCGDVPVVIANNGVNQITITSDVGLVLNGIITDNCNFDILLDTVTIGGLSTYYSGSGSLSGSILTYTYRADFSFGSGFDCDYSVQLSGGNNPSCTDGIQNGSETGIDCGGSCPACPTCTDGIQNGSETGVDCGGPDCDPCYSCDATVTDREGRTYNVIRIGSQCWMDENLKTTVFSNGNLIPLDNSNWNDQSGSVHTYYDNLSSNYNTYGALYSYYAIADPRGICPTGWHVPDEDEWRAMTAYLGGGNVGGQLKSTSSLWASPNVGATNSTGFSALPGGFRNYVGYYEDQGTGVAWWINTEVNSDEALFFGLNHQDEGTYIFPRKKYTGQYCRCMKDADTTVTNNPCNLTVTTTTTTSSATAMPSGGTGNYNYVWSNGATAATASGLSAGTYTVTVSEANDPGCTATASATVTSANNNCCDCTGIGFACDICCENGFDMLGLTWQDWEITFQGSGCNCN